MVFGISFASVNLTAFVKNDEARKRLETATIAADEGRYNDAVTQTAYAFDAILKSSPSHSVTSLLEIPSAPYIRNDEYSMNDDAHHYFEAVNRALEEMNERVSVLLLGIDFPRFSKFQTIAPEIITPLNGQPRHFDTRRGPSEHTSDSAEFCIAFVIDSAFRIQDHPVAFE